MFTQFRNAMADSGILYHDTIIADGHIHRFSNGGKNTQKNAWYVCYGNHGAFGDWKLGIHLKWRDTSSSHSHTHTRLIQKSVAVSDYKTKQSLAAMKAELWWKSGTKSGKSAYLMRKKVGAFSLRFERNLLLIPIRNLYGKLWSIQLIYPDGSKRFLKGGRKKGCFHLLGNLNESNLVYVTEGYATAASVYMATRRPTVCCFDSGNLLSVVTELKRFSPELSIIIAADNDRYSSINTGKLKAKEVARQFNTRICLPYFDHPRCLEQQRILGLHYPTDFNDLHQLMGLTEVRKQLSCFSA